MAIKTEETALAVRKEKNFELSESSMVASATAEVQAGHFTRSD